MMVLVSRIENLNTEYGRWLDESAKGAAGT
ncbi:MAG: hypothetical protein JWQ75_3893 [Pseudarthrobacter sp.]|nr:hypothetical protein [Pseudarthrobacter sp.]